MSIDRATQGILILGATGSGKSSGSGRAIALSYLKNGFGGLVLCVKADERRVWEKYCREAGRLDDLIIFGPEQPSRFNFVDYELNRSGRGAGLTENVRKMLTNVVEITKRDSGKGGGGDNDGPYWETAKNQLTRNVMDLLMYAKQPISISAIYDLLATAARSPEQAKSDQWKQSSFCYYCLATAHNAMKSTGKPSERDFNTLDFYWLVQFPGLAEKTRGIVESSLTAMVDVLNRGILRNLFCEESNITPEVIEAGKIVLVDLPVKEFADIGQYAAGIWKYCFQRAIERRDIQRNPRPVFLWQDEGQMFTLPTDFLFQSTCRAFNVCTVVLTQNINTFYATMGNASQAKFLVDSLFANLNLKIFHSNSDSTTNLWAAEMIGRAKILMVSANTSHGPIEPFAAAFGARNTNTSAGVNEIMEFEVQPSEFTKLRTGGLANRLLVDSIIHSTGSCFHATGRPYLFCTFSQK